MNARQERRERAGLEAMRLWHDTFTFHAESERNAARSPKTKTQRQAAIDSLSDIHKGIFGKSIGRVKVVPMLRTLDAWVKGETDANIDDATLVYAILEIMRVRYNDSASDDLHYRRGVSCKDILADAVSLSVDYRTAADVTDPSMGNTSNAWHARAWERMGEAREDCMSPLDILIRREEEDALRVCAADVA
jgi:hypothetical protein